MCHCRILDIVCVFLFDTGRIDNLYEVLFRGIWKDGLTNLPNTSPCYDLINNLLLFGTATPQINASGLNAFMSHQVSKQRNIVELLQKILGKAMAKRMRINHLLIQTIFCGISFLTAAQYLWW